MVVIGAKKVGKYAPTAHLVVTGLVVMMVAVLGVMVGPSRTAAVAGGMVTVRAAAGGAYPPPRHAPLAAASPLYSR